MEKTVIMLKPDAIVLEIQKELQMKLNDVGLFCLKSTTLQLTRGLILRWRNWNHYDDWFWKHVDFMTSSPVELWLVEGEDAISKTLGIKAYFRQHYAKSKIMNVLHCPDNYQEVEREINLFLTGVD